MSLVKMSFWVYPNFLVLKKKNQFNISDPVQKMGDVHQITELETVDHKRAQIIGNSSSLIQEI